MNKPKISLIICAYNEEKYIGKCLESVMSHCSKQLHEIIVVDNNSTDDTKEIVQKFRGIYLVSETSQGLTYARQKGLDVATGDILAYIDADTVVPTNWLTKALNFFEKNPKSISLSGPAKYYDASKMQSLVLNLVWWTSAPITYFFVGYMLFGANFLVKRDALNMIGGFDKSIEFYGEDTDIARRLSRLGPVVFKMDFFIHASCRRFVKEGLLKPNLVYATNFISQAFFEKSYTKIHNNIRIK